MRDLFKENSEIIVKVKRIWRKKLRDQSYGTDLYCYACCISCTEFEIYNYHYIIQLYNYTIPYKLSDQTDSFRYNFRVCRVLINSIQHYCIELQYKSLWIGQPWSVWLWLQEARMYYYVYFGPDTNVLGWANVPMGKFFLEKDRPQSIFSLQYTFRNFCWYKVC